MSEELVEETVNLIDDNIEAVEMKVEAQPIPKSYRKKKRGRPKKRKVEVEELLLPTSEELLRKRKIEAAEVERKEKEKKLEEEKWIDENKPVKRYVFRSNDKSFRMIWKSCYTRKERGETEFFPAEGVQFNDWRLIVKDTPGNQKVIKKLLNHPSRDIKFKLVTEKEGTAKSSIDIIEELEKMPEDELKARCFKNEIDVTGISKEKMIIELMKILTK